MVDADKQQALSDTERQEVSDALEAILATEKFDAAPQMSAFLRYVVEQAVDGNQSRIKAFTVAVDALGKPDTFDPQNDPVVRVLAGRLRAALSAHNAERPNDPVLITMTPGSYVPSFKRQLNDSQPDSDKLPQIADDAMYNGFHDQERAGEIDTGPGSATGVTETHKTSPGSGLPEIPAAATQDGSDEKTEYSVAEHAMREPAVRSDPKHPSGLLNGIFDKLLTTPRAVISCAVIGAVLIGLVQNFQSSDSDPDILAATPVSGPQTGIPAVRARPDRPAVFVSAVDQGNALENSLNTVVSSVISESDHLQVYRILEPEHNIRFWPEDYILTLTALDLPDEKRVSMQLMEADTGRIVHSRDVSLAEQADDQVTQAELAQLIDATQSIVSKTGPLVQHYNSRGQTQ